MGNLTANLSLPLCLTRGLDTGVGVPEYTECTRTGARSACNQNGEQACRGAAGGISGALMLLLLLPPLLLQCARLALVMLAMGV